MLKEGEFFFFDEGLLPREIRSGIREESPIAKEAMTRGARRRLAVSPPPSPQLAPFRAPQNMLLTSNWPKSCDLPL